MKVDVSFTLPTQFLAKVSKLANPGEAIQQSLYEIGASLKQASLGAFANESRTDGRPWAPLQPSTVALKERRGFSPEILQRQLGLVHSIDTHVGSNYVEVGTNVGYGALHMRGYTNETGHVPARPFLGLPGGSVEPLVAILMKHLTQS